MSQETLLQIGAALLAMLVAFWPSVYSAAERAAGWLWRDLPGPSQPAAPRPGPSYEKAIADLASVRRRLVETENLGDAQKAAVDTLTLALVAGSDK